VTASSSEFSPAAHTTYLVGGAVRDALLNRPVHDRDWVLVGTTPQALIAQGYTQVGADFPVFLHPHTKEEYALARTERKTGRGYAGFAFNASAEVTIEQDLLRRDLTINAIAQDTAGRFVDPFGGRADLAAGILRHVSDAFVEDPVRVLRIARFAARFAPLGFRIAPETAALMRTLVNSGELAHLVPERVFEELKKALTEPKPSAFLRALRACGALRVVFPEIDALYGVPQRARYHPEICTGVHQELVSDQAASLAPGDALLGFCALTHDFGKALTPAHVLPAHIGHEEGGVAPVAAFCTRLRVPTQWQDVAVLNSREHLNIHRIQELRAGSLVDLLNRLDAFRRPERVGVLALACTADKRGRLGLADSAYPQADLLRAALRCAQAVSTQSLIDKGLSGPAVGVALREARCVAVSAMLRERAVHSA
jgi:tRNA nucleotidyltransferase (CCA-adding enzyme)